MSADDHQPLWAGVGHEAVDDGTAAVLQGMMAMLAEVLGGVERRLANLERTAGRRLDTAEGRLTAGQVEEAVAAAVEGLEQRLRQSWDPRQVEEAVAAAVEGLEQRLRQSRDAGQAGASAAMSGALDRLGALSGQVETMRAELAGVADRLERSPVVDRVESLRASVAAMEAEVAETREVLVDHPVIEVGAAVARLSEEIEALVQQPGPGPAVAMVAAGLAERFEERTRAVVELLEANAGVARQLWERTEAFLDRGGYEELAVAQALEDIIDNQEVLSDSIQQLVASVEGRQVGLDALLDTVRAMAVTNEGMAVRVDDTRERMAALTVAVESLHSLLSEHVEETASSFGRRASEAGRKLAADLGLKTRAKRPAEAPQLEGGPP